ncbi:Putative permease PerM (YfgO) [Pseudomonas chlororaphis subsp. aurantiaca]|nr:Putative permease PerM (YfgO) [Pseudomonas chlororaphis subsp. aurantiaca]
MGLLLVFIVVVVPLLWHQLITLFNELPGMLAKWQSLLLLLPERYPHLVSDEQVLQAIEVARGEIGKFGQWALTFSLSSLPLLVNIMIYLVLVPILVFFFLKDRAMISQWVRGYLPRERALITRVAQEMNRQIANYIRGKVIEIVICGGVTYIAFVALGLNYAALLALLVGISVVVPYVGAVVVTVPVALIALFQWGWSDQFIYLMAVYGIIQTLDGNVLVPLLFSEAVNLHPVAIICAVLLFGGLWGFWGYFSRFPWLPCSRPYWMPGRVRNRSWRLCCRAVLFGKRKGAAESAAPFLVGCPAQALFSACAAASTASTWPGTFTPRHSWRSTPFLSIRKVLRSTPMYSLP